MYDIMNYTVRKSLLEILLLWKKKTKTVGVADVLVGAQLERLVQPRFADGNTGQTYLDLFAKSTLPGLLPLALRGCTSSLHTLSPVRMEVAAPSLTA